MISALTSSRRTLLLLTAAVVAIWGYIAIRLESVSSSQPETTTEESGVGIETRIPQIMQGGTTYDADFEDPFEQSRPLVERSEAVLATRTDDATRLTREFVYPPIRVTGLVGKTVIVSTATQSGLLRAEGDSLDGGTISQVLGQGMTMQLSDTLIEFTMAGNPTNNFTIDKPE